LLLGGDFLLGAGGRAATAAGATLGIGAAGVIVATLLFGALTTGCAAAVGRAGAAALLLARRSAGPPAR
jgi:hypothetical protein